jgi:hypothetical protein
MRPVHAVAAASAVSLGALATACSALLGFEDATDLRDGGSLFDVTAGGLVAPSDAAGMVCVPAPPDLWQGPLIFYEAQGASLPAPPDCPAPYALIYDGHGSPTGPPADCNCTCGPPTNVACTPPVMNLFTNTCTAGNECAVPTQPIGKTCTNLNLGGCGGPHFTISGSSPEGGSCAPATPNPTLRPSAWTVEVRLCAFRAAPTGCADGKVATPATGLPFDPNYCIAQKNDTNCPPTYPVKRSYYEAYTDDRACDPCTCGPPTGVTCTGTVTTGGANTCTGGAVYNVPLTTCTNDPKAAAIFDGGPTGGSCAPQSHPKGGLTATTPTTVCCVQ